ncbi:MAG: hypothetical protein JW940_02615, partial [Polyangiaceae bacterium]|nr:hypothetical protein [Polyangiaceae bacterium]
TALATPCLWGAPAGAQTTDGALQLGIGTGLVDYTSSTIDVELPAPGTTTAVHSSSLEWGVAQGNRLDVEGGYGLGELLVLGGLVSLGGQSVKSDQIGNTETKDSRFSLFVGPKLDLMLMPGEPIRPFFGFAAGLRHGLSKSESTNDQDVTTTTDRQKLSGVELLARAGIRWFPVQGFSIDPAIVFGWATLSGSRRVRRGPGPALYDDVDASGTRFAIGLDFAVSGWIGL